MEKLTITIAFDQVTGQVKIDGAIDNPVLAFGMLEIARQAVHKYHEKKASERRVIPMTTALPRM